MIGARPSRWWIVAIPFAIALMLAASGYRVGTFWFHNGQHRVLASADAGEWARASEDYTDVFGDTTRSYAVRLAGWGQESSTVVNSRGEEFALPDGMVARTVNLEFEAEPDQALTSCTISLIDDRGRRFDNGGSTSQVANESSACVPEETPGPSLAVLDSDVRGATPDDTQPRPTRWATSPQVVVPRDAEIVEVRVSFEHPDYVRLTPER